MAGLRLAGTEAGGKAGKAGKLVSRQARKPTPWQSGRLAPGHADRLAARCAGCRPGMVVNPQVGGRVGERQGNLSE